MKTLLSVESQQAATSIWNKLQKLGKFQVVLAHFEISITIPYNHGIQLALIIVDVRDYTQTAVLIGVELFIQDHNGVVWLEKGNVSEADLEELLNEVHLSLPD